MRKEVLLAARSDEVWDALRDFGQLHRRLVPGYVVDATLDGDDRIITFFNGVTVKELLVDLDDAARRLVWSLVDGPYSHHNGSAQVFDEGDGRTRFVWVADFLPHELAPVTSELMDMGMAALRETLEP